MKFRFGAKLIIDSNVAPYNREGLRIAMLGGPGSGKSHNNALIIEQFLTQGGTVVIFQPRDEYFTLKEKFDVLSVGGVHAKDMEFALTSPKIYAKAVVEDGISMVFYTSDVENEEKLVDWVSRFIKAILRLQEVHKRPLLLLLEEADEYTPKSASGHVAPPWVYNRMIKVFKDCFSQGRKLNIIGIVSSQRPQELNFTIRQLANLTFFGKFSDQDIGYVDKECLKYIRKRGIKVDASELVTLGLGEWLVIMGEKTRYVKVTQKRLTKHGAETPSLEYVAPRTSKVTKTIDQLTATILEALKKEESDRSEVEKLKRKNRDLTKKLEVAEKKAEVKLAVKEMLTEGNSTELVEKLTRVTEKLTNAKETIRVLREQKPGKELQEENKRLSGEMGRIMKRNDELALELEQLRPLKQLRDALLKIFPQGIEPGTSAAKIGLQNVKTVVDVEDVEIKPTIKTDTVAGKILTIAKKGKMSTWRKLGFIVKTVTEEGWTVTSKQVNKALNDLVAREIIAKKHTNCNYFKVAKNVVFK